VVPANTKDGCSTLPLPLRTFSFDVAGSKSKNATFVVVCPVDAKEEGIKMDASLPSLTPSYEDLSDVTITLQLEYQWGPNQYIYSLPAGG